MWGEDMFFNNTTNSRRSPSLYAKSSSSSSQFLASSPVDNSRRKTMEEVWEDINMSSLHQDHHHRHTRQPTNLPFNQYNHNTFKGVNLQDFLARPFDRDQSSGLDFSHFGSSIAAAAAPPPQTSPCLNTVRELYYLDSNNNSNDAFDSCSAFPPFCKKRSSESEDSNGDRRHKRMIKNRESAARSRARKQSYTNELEIKVSHLKEENKRLLKEQEELYLAAAAAVAVQLPKKHNLQRSSSAPF